MTVIRETTLCVISVSPFSMQVYLPCVLQTKKRYVGYMYETLDQKEPVFDAKGIETVRRDSCPAVAKVCVIHSEWPVTKLLLTLLL